MNKIFIPLLVFILMVLMPNSYELSLPHDGGLSGLDDFSLTNTDPDYYEN